MSKVLIGIGTNIGDRKQNIKDSLEALKKIPLTQVVRTSSVYETKPWGYTEQNNFYNAVVEIKTELSPQAILGVCLGIEAALGRVRLFKNGPRIADLDVLFYENITVSNEELVIPHPYIGERDFVLVPLKELFPDLTVYGFDYSENYKKVYNDALIFKVDDFE